MNIRHVVPVLYLFYFIYFVADLWMDDFYIEPKILLSCRKRLFNMINDLPTVFEVVTGAAKKQQKEKLSVPNNSGNKSKSNSKVVNMIFSWVVPNCGYICWCGYWVQWVVTVKCQGWT